MQEIEEDPDMRQYVALYKDPVAIADAANAMDTSDAESDGHELQVPLDELLEELDLEHSE